MQASSGELAAARWLDAEDAAIQQALTWALEHDLPTALRLADGPGALVGFGGAAWRPDTRCCAPPPRTPTGPGRVVALRSAGWAWRRNVTGDCRGCAQPLHRGRDAVGGFAGRRRCWLTPQRAGRAACATSGACAEAADDARRALALARELGYPGGKPWRWWTQPGRLIRQLTQQRAGLGASKPTGSTQTLYPAGLPDSARTLTPR